MPGDAESLAACQSDAGYMEFYDAPLDASAIIAMAREWAAADPRVNFQVVSTFRAESAAIGCIGIRQAGYPQGAAEFGCELDPSYWGRGLAYEASAAMLRFGFDRLGLTHVIGLCNPQNGRVLRMAARLGFVHGGIHDGSLELVLARAEFERSLGER